MKIQKWMMSAPIMTMLACLTSCKDEAQTRKIKELEERSTEQVSEIESLNNKIQSTEEERNKLRDECANAQREANTAKQKAEQLQKQIDSMRQAEQAARAAARTAAQSNPADEGKKIAQEKIQSIWTIEGDLSACRGIAAEADGKTWLYFPATALKGSTKISVKDSSGTIVTKFGELQIATDANLARLEIKQNVSPHVTLASQADIGENPQLLTATIASEGEAITLNVSQSGALTATDIEVNSYSTSSIYGFPVFNALNGNIVAITLPHVDSSADAGLWDTPQPTADATVHAARLDRTIAWKSSSMGALLSDRRKIDELIRVSRLLDAVAMLRPTASGLNMQATINGGSVSVQQFLTQNKDTKGVAELIKLDETLATQKVRMSDADINRQFSGIAGSFIAASRKAAAELKATKPSPCYLTDTETALKWNEVAEKRLSDNLSRSDR